jgi:hypothetical protein
VPLSKKDRDIALVLKALGQLSVSDTNLGRMDNQTVAKMAQDAFDNILRNEYPKEDLSTSDRFGKLPIE